MCGHVCITPPHRQPHDAFRRVVSIPAGSMLLCGEVAVSADSPHISKCTR